MNLTLWPALETPFLLLGCLVQLPYEGVYLVFLCLVLSCLAVFSWRLLFSEKEMVEDWIWKYGGFREVESSGGRIKCSPGFII